VSRYRFIVNPKSGSNAYAGTIRRLRDYLRRRGHTVEVDLTRSLPHAAELARQARSGDYRALVIAGGDGTVRTVAGAMAGSTLPLLIVPTGTENLVAGELGLDGSLETSIRALENGRVRRLDLAIANERHFIAVAGIGFDGEVIRRLSYIRAGHITHTDYLWPICRTFWEYRFAPLRVEADGELLCREPALAFVGNISRYAVKLEIFPDADCSDGFLDLTVYKCPGRRVLLGHALLTLLRQSHRVSSVLRRKCRHIRVSADSPRVAVQLDGDPGPSLPLDIRVFPGAARVLTPPAPPGYDYCPPVRFYLLRQWLGR